MIWTCGRADIYRMEGCDPLSHIFRDPERTVVFARRSRGETYIQCTIGIFVWQQPFLQLLKITKISEGPHAMVHGEEPPIGMCMKY